MTRFSTLLAALTCLTLTAAGVGRAGEIRTQAIRFAAGQASAVINGRIKGDQTIDYTLRAKAGQTLSVTLKTDNGANYFNVLPPGSKDAALFIGSTLGNDWSGTLPADGEYTLRVYLMRSAARRHETARYTLTVSVSGSAKGDAATELGKAPAGDAKVKGTPYHATGLLPCSLDENKPVPCEFGVIRGKPGNAEVHITPAGGLKRVLIFMGEKVRTNTGETLKATRQDDDWSVKVNEDERYTIPDAIITGG